MNLAIVQPVAGAWAKRFPYREDVAALGATLLAHGHKVTLTVLDTCDEVALAAAMTGSQPELIFIYVESPAADLAFRIAGALALLHRAPTLPFGPHAALKPDECLSMTGAEAVAISPADVTAPGYLAAGRNSLDYLRMPGFWVKCETGVMRNPPSRPPESLDHQPLPARELYFSDQVLDAAGMAYVRVARGGEGGASPAATDPHGAGTWPMSGVWPVLHRPVESVIQEMLNLAEVQLDLGGFRIGNERWVSDAKWLAEFAPLYARKVAFPFRTTLHAPDITPEAAELLAVAKGGEVRVPVGSGSAMIRNDILGLHVTDDALAAAFAALRKAGVRSAASVEVGAPYETPASLQQTVEFLRRLDPDRVDAVLHYPVPGTPADKAARENGWLVPDPVAAHLAGKPAVALPRLSADDIITALESLPFAVLRPHIVPLIRLSRRVTIGKRGTLYDVAVKPFLAPPVRQKR